jgi:hypothetical protein
MGFIAFVQAFLPHKMIGESVVLQDSEGNIHHGRVRAKLDGDPRYQGKTVSHEGTGKDFKRVDVDRDGGKGYKEVGLYD